MNDFGMSDLIAARSMERVEIYASAESRRPRARDETPVVEDLPAHQFPVKKGAVEGTGHAVAEHAGTERPVPEQSMVEQAIEPRLGRAEMEDREREQRIYRGRTVGMLRRYLRYSIEAGRLPSMLGSEFFRAKVTAYTVVTFEDRVIFVHDMEKCLDRLDGFSRQLIARHILQEHDLEATGRLLGCTERTVRTYVPIVLDLFSDILLEVGMLERVESNREKSCENSCQGGLESEISASDWEDGKYKF